MIIYFWADGTWCYEENLEEYLTCSDDYTIIKVPDVSDDQIDEIVANELKLQGK